MPTLPKARTRWMRLGLACLVLNLTISWSAFAQVSDSAPSPKPIEPERVEPERVEPETVEPETVEPETVEEPLTSFPPVRWQCDWKDGGPLETRFEAGGVTVTWEGETARLDHVPSDVGAAYVGWGESGGNSLRVRPDDRAVFTSGERVMGCRAQRHRASEALSGNAEPTAIDLLTALVLEIPIKRSELFRIVGPIESDSNDQMSGFSMQHEFRDEGPVSSVMLEPDFDIHHGNPNHPNPQLDTWSVVLRGDPNVARGLLRSQYGEGIELVHRERATWRYGSFYLRPWTSSFNLTYRKYEPEWVVPPLDDDVARREIARIERVFRGGIRRADLESEFGPLGPDPWRGSLQAWTRHWRVDVKPVEGPLERIFLTPRGRPIPAGSLIQTLGIKTPVVVSRDVHLSARKLEDAETGPLRLGNWKVEICIDRNDLERAETGQGPPTWSSESFAVCGITLRDG